jgi:hypothetical protein
MKVFLSIERTYQHKSLQRLSYWKKRKQVLIQNKFKANPFYHNNWKEIAKQHKQQKQEIEIIDSLIDCCQQQLDLLDSLFSKTSLSS